MKLRKITTLALAITATSGHNALAQQSLQLEEILVTSQKREQRLGEVPISVNTVSGSKLEQLNITGIERMADYVPGLNMTETGIGTTVSIRGISSGVNQGFEQSAAQFVDGVHFGRAQLSRAPFLDIERVEVLRGPQSILFGKNSTAGAISITSARPTQEFEGKLTGLYEPDHSERDLRLVLSGPLTDTLSGRIAILDREMDGAFKNTTLNRDESQEDDQVVRGILNWQPNERWDMTLKLEDGSFDRLGRNLEVINEITTDIPGVPTTTYSQVLANLTGALSGGQEVFVLDTNQDFKRQSNGDFSFNDTQTGVLEIETHWRDLSITSVTGYNAYDYEELCDCDFTGVPLFNILSQEDYSQWSQEIRIASPESRRFSYIGGLFYQSGDLEFDDAIRVPQESILPAALGFAGVPGAALLSGTSTQREFQQDSDIAAIFFEGTYRLTDSFRLVAGGRFSDEEKTASRRQFHLGSNGQELPLGSPTDPLNVLYGLFNIEAYETLSEERNESKFTPAVRLEYDLDENSMLYLSYTTGFKSGGFDVRSNSHPDPLVNNAVNISSGSPQPITGVFEFDDEEVINIEWGGKFRLLDGRAELNAALFYTEFEDLQTSQFDGAFSFNVTNAAEASIHGLELDGRILLRDNLTLSGGFAYIDFEYDDFPTAQCYFGQALPPQTQCDASGETREFTPELQGNLSLNHSARLGDYFRLASGLDLIYSDDYIASPTLDPRTRQDSFVKLNARLALSDYKNRWELAVIGKNLTDEEIMTYANNLPVATVLTNGTGSANYAFFERPRSISIQGTLKF